MPRPDARAQMAAALDLAADYLRRVYGVAVKARPRRDTREPRLAEKEAAEDALAAAVMRHFRRLAARVRVALAEMPRVKATLDVAGIDFEDDDFVADLIRILLVSAQGGVELFAEQVLIGMDYSATNTRAAEWARQYAYDLVRGLDDTTRDALQRAVSAFVETPGMTIRDVMNALPFDERRALRIATTEITRAYSTAAEIAGKELEREFPGVRVVKVWATNNDDRVCPICGPLDGMEVGMGEGFTTEADRGLGIPYPPAHPGCRCWISSRTRING